MDIDKVQAAIITDRCTPPKGLGSAPSTIKAVIWCLRGLGAPGSDLCVHLAIVERRTCLSARAVRSVISILREFAILTLIEAPAPGRASRYRMDYKQLAEWLDDGDREAARLLDGGSTRHRSEAAHATERRHHTPPIKSTVAARSATVASDAATVAAHSATVAPDAGDIKEETAIPAKPAAAAAQLGAEQLLAAAAAGGLVDGVEEWIKLGKGAGLQVGDARQCAQALHSLGLQDREIGINALERLSERMKGGGVQNPIGLLRSFVDQRDDLESSVRANTRKRNREQRRDQFSKFVRDECTPENYERIRTRTRVILEGVLGIETTDELMPDGEFRELLNQWPTMLDFVLSRWNEIRTMQGAASV